MTRWIVGLVVCLALSAAGCGGLAERNEAREDLRRFREQRAIEFAQMKRDLSRYATDNLLRARELPIDLDHFLRWHRREWWNLTDEVAAVMTYEREEVQKLTEAVARCYGYEVRNFPLVTEDLARFFRYAEPEYASLVKDAVAFIEIQHRELLPLRREVQEALNQVVWEAGNLQIDVQTFLEWREREWKKLAAESSALVTVESQMGQRLRDDLRRFRAARAIEGSLLVADFKAYWRYESEAMPPRLIDDLISWDALSAQEFARLRVDVTQFGEGIGQDTIKLVDDVTRFTKTQLEVVPQLVIEVELFFSNSRFEYQRLDAGVRRFWAANVALGILSREDMRLFFIEHSGEEAAEMQDSVRRFFAYSRKEWKDFRGAIARFCWDDSGRAFGNRSGSMSGITLPSGGDDPRAYPVRGYDAGDQ